MTEVDEVLQVGVGVHVIENTARGDKRDQLRSMPVWDVEGGDGAVSIHNLLMSI